MSEARWKQIGAMGWLMVAVVPFLYHRMWQQHGMFGHWFWISTAGLLLYAGCSLLAYRARRQALLRSAG